MGIANHNLPFDPPSPSSLSVGYPESYPEDLSVRDRLGDDISHSSKDGEKVGNADGVGVPRSDDYDAVTLAGILEFNKILQSYFDRDKKVRIVGI